MPKEITIPDQSIWDERSELFINVKGATLCLEHSLISLSKWESKWHIPFLGKNEKTAEQVEDYIRCMTLTQHVNPEVYHYIPSSIMKEIFDYIEDPMTATWFSKVDEGKGGINRGETITAEIVYYWMVTLNIPVQFEKWHLNRLLTLIRVINAKNAPAKKMSKREILARNRQLNAARRAKSKSRG